MIDLIARGYTIGGGLISPDNELFFLPIPKNASTFISSVLYQNNWRYANLSEFTGDQVFCILRDPLDRWISGIATYFALYIINDEYDIKMFLKEYNQLTEKLIFDNIIFDDHTTPQIDFLNIVPKNKNIVSFTIDEQSLLQKLSEYLKYDLSYDLSITNENFSKDNYVIQHIIDLIKSRLQENMITKIKVKYKADYTLLQYAR